MEIYLEAKLYKIICKIYSGFLSKNGKKWI